MNIRNSQNKFKDHYKYKYITYFEALSSLYKTKNLKFKRLKSYELKLYKSSNTVFILGSGPSLNSLSSNQINQVKLHDSFGINYSFFKSEIIPTYQYFGWHKDRYYRWLELFSPFREKYTDVVIMMHNKSLYSRLIHPRLTPKLFPKDPIIHISRLPPSLYISEERKIRDDEFNKSLLYRGSLSFVLHIVVNMGYKRIVLLGIDLNTNKHFFDDLPQMNNEKYLRKEKYSLKGLGEKFESQYPINSKMVPFGRYLIDLCDYLNRKKNISLYTGFKDKIFNRMIPEYFTTL